MGPSSDLGIGTDDVTSMVVSSAMKCYRVTLLFPIPKYGCCGERVQGLKHAFYKWNFFFA